MEPMKPMARMAPMKPLEAWWPADLGQPSTAGSQNRLRYAFFRGKRRLLIERDGEQILYDTGEHDIGGVSQADGGLQSVEFTSQLGPVRLGELAVIR